MLTILLVIVLVVTVVAMVGVAVNLMTGSDIFGTWLALETMKGFGYVLGVIVQAIVESMNQS